MKWYMQETMEHLMLLCATGLAWFNTPRLADMIKTSHEQVTILNPALDFFIFGEERSKNLIHLLHNYHCICPWARHPSPLTPITTYSNTALMFCTHELTGHYFHSGLFSSLESLDYVPRQHVLLADKEKTISFKATVSTEFCFDSSSTLLSIFANRYEGYSSLNHPIFSW